MQPSTKQNAEQREGQEAVSNKFLRLHSTYLSDIRKVIGRLKRIDHLSEPARHQDTDIDETDGATPVTLSGMIVFTILKEQRETRCRISLIAMISP